MRLGHLVVGGHICGLVCEVSSFFQLSLGVGCCHVIQCLNRQYARTFQEILSKVYNCQCCYQLYSVFNDTAFPKSNQREDRPKSTLSKCYESRKMNYPAKMCWISSVIHSQESVAVATVNVLMDVNR